MRRFLSGVAVGAIGVLLGLVGVGHFLDVEDPLAPADAIVALSGDSGGARVDTAVALWRAGLAPRLIFAGASVDPDSAPSGELMKREAVRLGVPEAAIVVEPASATTEENAKRVAALMAGAGLRSAILVTSPYHQRRASILFGREFGAAGLSFRNHPARDPQWDPNVWWAAEPSRSLTVLELAKLSALVVTTPFRT